MPPTTYLSVRFQVGWGDCDPAGIVFYPRFYAWMDAASHLLAREMGIAREAMIAPAHDLLGLPVVATEASYLRPARMDDQLEVRAWVTRIGRSSLGLRHEIIRLDPDGSETLVARGRENRVFTSYKASGLTPQLLTPAMRQAMTRFADPHSTPPQRS